MSGEGIFACEANAKIVTARRGRAGGVGSGKCKRKRGYTKGWRGCGRARGRDFCGRNTIFNIPIDRSKNRDSPK